jgi:hypothetical protein
LRLMPWIAANHGIEGAASTSAAGKNCQPMSPRRDCHLVGNSSVEKIWVRFAKPAYVRSITACSLGPSRRTGHLSKACWWIVGSQAERLTAEFAATSGWREDLNRSIDRVLV